MGISCENMSRNFGWELIIHTQPSEMQIHKCDTALIIPYPNSSTGKQGYLVRCSVSCSGLYQNLSHLEKKNCPWPCV